MWAAVASLLEARPQGADKAKLGPSLQALDAFSDEFGAFAHSADSHLQTRIYSGYAGQSAHRPGLIELLQDVFVAAGLGEAKLKDTAGGA